MVILDNLVGLFNSFNAGSGKVLKFERKVKIWKEREMIGIYGNHW